MQEAGQFRSGYIAIIGRPNTGKSTLLNGIVNRKISIVSKKPQTTRWHIQGVKTTDNYQLVFVDTPGYQTAHNTAINKLMQREVMNSLSYCDLIIWMTVAMQWQADDEQLLALLREAGTPVILLLNKVDQVTDKQALLPCVDKLSSLYPFREIIPLVARKAKDIALLESKVSSYMPAGEMLYDADTITDRSERFITAEYLREQIFLQTGDELPYRTAVTIEKYDEQEKLVSIYATIWIEKESHKAIIIGEKGARLKRIGQAARATIQSLLQKKVFLQSRVKVKKNWTDDIKALRQLGYMDAE
ncbi:MAG: GTPase Era [Gammaproteobacteria bacterium]